MSGFEVPLISLALSLGSQLVMSLFQKPPKQADVNLQMPKSDYGVGIPKIYGKVRLEGNKFFPQTKNLMYKTENVRTSSGGKGGGRSRQTTEKKVYGSVAVLFCEGKVNIEQLIIQGEYIAPDHPFFTSYCTWFDGTQDAVWSVVSQDEEPYKFIKYKGVAYVGIHEAPLDRYGNQIFSQVAAILVDDEFGTQPTLDLVVGDILTRAGLDGSLWDVSDLNQIILRDGLVVQQSGESYRQVIEGLMEFYLFAPFQDGTGKLIFRRLRRGDSSVISLNNRYFVPNDNDNSYIQEIKSDFELPTKLSVKYYNNSRRYEQDEIHVYLGNKTESDNNVKNISEVLYSYGYEIDERARLILSYLYSQEKNKYLFKLPIYYYSQFKCLDVVTLPNGQTVQITKVSIGADYVIDIEANYYDSVEASYISVPETAIEPPVLTVPQIPEIYIIDAPVLPNDVPGSLYCFATHAPTVIQYSEDGLNWYNATTHLYGSVIGECLTTIGSTLDVDLSWGQGLESITDDEYNVNLGANLAFVGRNLGNGVYEGEYIQFRDVQILGTKQYRLSTLKRGLNNTGGFNHSSGEKFFLFKGVGAYYSIIVGNANFIGSSVSFRPVVSDWQNLATTPTVAVTPVGNAYKPPPPTNLSGIIDEDGNIKMFWDYSNDFSPFNNSQQQESITYEIDVLNSSGIPVRTLESTQKNVIYTVLDRTTDGIPDSFNVTIYAISSVVGRGYPYTDTLVPVLVDDNIFATGDGLAGIKFIYADYIVTEADISYILVVINPNATTITLTFPPHPNAIGESDLSNGFTCYVISEKNNNNSAVVELVFDFTYTGLANNFITTGNSGRVFHISQGKFFVFGNSTNLIGYEDNVVNITGSQTLSSNTIYEVIAPATLTFPPAPVRGDLIHLVDSPGTFSSDNAVILDGNGYTIEGVSQFVLEKRDENIQFYFNGFQWVYISRFFYIDANDIAPYLIDGDGNAFPVNDNGQIEIDVLDRTLPLTVSTNYTITNDDYKKWIKASGDITITVQSNPIDYFEVIVQNVGTGTITISGVANAVGTTITGQWRACHLYYDGSSWTGVGALE